MRGRTFSTADNSTNAAPVVLCSETLTRKVFPNENPIGKHVQFDRDAKKFEIVGMVGDIKLTQLLDNRLDRIYFPQIIANGSLIVRTRVAPASLANPIRQAILEVDRDQPVSNIRTLARYRSFGRRAAAYVDVARLRNQLYQVGTTDPGTLAAVALLLGIVAFFACLIPARRATKVDPMEALRDQ